MKHRLERVSELLKRELSEMIARQLTFSAALVTVQHVDVSPDLKNASVYVSAIGSDEEKAAVIAKLEEHRADLQHQVSRHVVLKYTPHLHFRLDDSIERGTRVIQILEELDIPDED
jgi:ribosome-binding factor A